MGFFGNVKKRLDDFETRATVKKASKLKGLREQRLKAEGRAKVSRLYDKEKGRIKAAKKESFERSYSGRALKGLKKFQKKSKGRKLKPQRMKAQEKPKSIF